MNLLSSDVNQVTPEKMNPGKPDKHKVATSVAELKNGRVLFKQKPISFDSLSETMQEIVNFRALLDASSDPLVTIPHEHLPLIAKLVHESDKSISALARALQTSLLPPALGSSQDPAQAPDVLPASVLEHAIKAVAERTNYGINNGMDRPPAALCVWRWEVKNKEWLPQSVRERACQRFNERIAAKKHLQALFADLSGDERDALLKNGKGGKTLKSKEYAMDGDRANQQPIELSIQDKNGEATRSSGSDAKKPGRPKKVVDIEVVEKEKEKQEKKAIKAEKEKKDAEATKRSAAVFANFFKPGGSSKTTKSSSDDPATVSVSSSSAAAQLSDFEATFKPFVVKKDVQLAPINWFTAERLKERRICRRSTDKGKRDVVFELDDEDKEVNMRIEHCGPVDPDREDHDVSSISPRELLRSFLASQPPSLHPHLRPPIRMSTQSGPTYRVREIVHQLSEAEVHGDQRTARKLTALLKNRRKIPAKVFVFTENIRPGYLGTWTKTVSSIGPTTPFARDLLSFDYDHDSDAEWEVGGGDEIDSLDESMDDDSSSVATDLDGWLVESDDIDLEPTKAADEPRPPLSSSNKRKVAGPRQPSNKKRKIVPLVPFQKGPVWEPELGHCEYEPFRPMRVQFLNDTPLAMDPFTFVSDSAFPQNGIPCAAKKDAQGVFVIPALPDRLLATTSPAVVDSIDDTCEAKRKAAAPSAPSPKTTFPEAHVPLLLSKIATSNTNSFAVLLDSIFQDMKPLGVKKNALEVKLRDIAEKDKAKMGWVVKEDGWARHGLTKPT